MSTSRSPRRWPAKIPTSSSIQSFLDPCISVVAAAVIPPPTSSTTTDAAVTTSFITLGFIACWSLSYLCTSICKGRKHWASIFERCKNLGLFIEQHALRRSILLSEWEKERIKMLWRRYIVRRIHSAVAVKLCAHVQPFFVILLVIFLFSITGMWCLLTRVWLQHNNILRRESAGCIFVFVCGWMLLHYRTWRERLTARSQGYADACLWVCVHSLV